MNSFKYIGRNLSSITEGKSTINIDCSTSTSKACVIQKEKLFTTKMSTINIRKILIKKKWYDAESAIEI